MHGMFDERTSFCACAFMDKIFILGGHCFNKHDDWIVMNSCLQFDSNDNSWKEVCEMKEEREVSACIVFQENIVVSGGENFNDVNDLNSVESYDVFGNKWTSMPNMVNYQSFHNLVVVKNKLFVIGLGTENCEFFDNACKKFVVLKHQQYIYYNKSVSIGNIIFIFQEFSSSVICYDVVKNEWSEEPCEVAKYLKDFTCVKIPSY